MAAVPATARLGDRDIPRVGLGTNRLKDTEANRSFLCEAASAGLGFIDTAHLYAGGESEATIGAAFGDGPGRPVVATKAGFLTNEGGQLRAEIETSFERLRSEAIDLYYVHRLHGDAPLAQTLGILREYVDAGRIRHVGLSEVSIGEIDQAREMVPIAAVQNEYSLGERKHEAVIRFCELQDMLFVPFFPLRGDRTAALREAADRHGATINQIKLAWLLHRSPCVVPIPGTLSIEHLRENLAALEIELGEEEIEALSA
jgi:pyridoxine 4-dehydrogenase